MFRKSYAAIGALLLLGLAVFAVRSWLETHDDLLQMRATIAAQQQLIAAADARERDRAATLQQTLAQINDLKRRTQTPAQILRDLPQYLPLPQPIELSPPAASQAPQRSAAQAPETAAPTPGTQQGSAASEKSRALLPEKPTAQLPIEDLKPLYDFVQDCRACQAQLTAAQADLHDERAKSVALANQRDAAVKAAKGGGFWTRVKRNAKWLAIGAGVGAAVARGLH